MSPSFYIMTGIVIYLGHLPNKYLNMLDYTPRRKALGSKVNWDTVIKLHVILCLRFLSRPCEITTYKLVNKIRF